MNIKFEYLTENENFLTLVERTQGIAELLSRDNDIISINLVNPLCDSINGRYKGVIFYRPKPDMAQVLRTIEREASLVHEKMKAALMTGDFKKEADIVWPLNIEKPGQCVICGKNEIVWEHTRDNPNGHKFFVAGQSKPNHHHFWSCRNPNHGDSQEGPCDQPERPCPPGCTLA